MTDLHYLQLGSARGFEPVQSGSLKSLSTPLTAPGADPGAKGEEKQELHLGALTS